MDVFFFCLESFWDTFTLKTGEALRVSDGTKRSFFNKSCGADGGEDAPLDSSAFLITSSLLQDRELVCSASSFPP